jgi:uncharacterized membrane protein YesL
MNYEKFMNSRIYRFLDYIFRLVLLNFLIFITALSFYLFLPEKTPNWLKDTLSFGQMGLLFFPSLVAVFDVIKQYEQNKSTSILRPFFQSLKKHYKSSLLMGIGMLIIAILLSNSINVFLQQFQNGLINVIGFFLTVSVILVLLFSLVHLPLVLVNFSGLRLIDYGKLSVIWAFRDFGLTLMMLVIVVFVLITDIVFPYFLAFFGISLPIYLLVKLSLKSYAKYSEKHKGV